MPKKQRKFADDGWAVWIEGDDTSTIYINDWLDPKDKSFIDVAIRIRRVKSSKSLNLYVPFKVSKEEIEDISLQFDNVKILQAVFSATCLVDYMKNKHTSEIAYNGKTIDIVHISTFDFSIRELSRGIIINIDIEKIQPFIDNDEAYFIFRMPHKSLDEIFIKRTNVENFFTKFRDLITTPVVSEKYVYSIRINESRLLPEEITRIGAFHRQKLKKAVVTISINESYEINDSSCYRIHRLEEGLYKEYVPKKYNCEDVINYQWYQNQDYNYQGKFNFYHIISKNQVSKKSMLFYMILLITVGVFVDFIYDVVKSLFELIIGG